MKGVGKLFPDFNLAAVNGNNELFRVDSEASMADRWSVIYFYPKDFTFICPTEIRDFDLVSVNDDTFVLGISGDNEYCKQAWRESNDLIKDIRHNLAADCGLQLAEELGIVDKENGVAFRATYIIDPAGYIQHVSVNALDTGRNAQEVARTLEALKSGGLTGCSWAPGEDFVG